MKNLIFVLLLFPLIISAQVDVCALNIGNEVPEATLLDQDGQEQNLQELMKDKPTVLLFFRGGWCGYCTKHLAAIQDVKDEVEAAGYQLIGITPDHVDNLEKSVEKSKSDYPIYSDFQLQAITGFGVAWKVDDELYAKYKKDYELDLEEWSGDKHHVLPVPAVYIIKDNKVQFNYVNKEYSIRLEPATLVALLKTI